MKMGSGKNDFVLDSKGRCFLCLDNISVVKHELGSRAQPFPKHSLDCLSRYLKMDMRKVFSDVEQISAELLAKVASSRLRAELCEECVSLIEEFSENYRKLEQTEMELKFSLNRIHAKFLDTQKTDHQIKLKNLISMEPKLSSGGELEILEVLREEAFQKSHHKLHAVMPRVKFSNLTKKAIRRKQLGFKANVIVQKEPQKTSFVSFGDCSKSEVEESEVKMEVETPDSASDGGTDHYSLDDSTPQHDAMSDESENKNLTVEEHTDYHNTNPEMRTFPSLATNMQYNSRTQVGIPEAIIDQETGKHKCLTCGLQFSRKYNYDRHQKSAHVGVRYACSVCNKSFSFPSNVQRHQRLTDCGKKLGSG